MQSIRITTYDEVRRSYPRTKIVESVEEEDKLAAWWDQSYEEQTGPLHRMKYHRIIIDGMLCPRAFWPKPQGLD